ncbi:MAG TPA: molybdopterin converting factor subunit 1 [Tepidisphaeraceae bacterium]|jgi:molybdopterin synthase catalytic subunit|nr:molybdopterin converting factor subunit 1 [Tepidisphaeraceae bacterium]
MKINLKFFAILHDLAGVREGMLDLPQGATVSDASNAIAKQFPSIAKHLPRVAYAVNQEYRASDAVLSEGDELALIPPVSGG